MYSALYEKTVFKAYKAGYYSSYYAKEEFWPLIKKLVKAQLKPVAIAALTLFFMLEDPNVPKWAKSTIYGALGYLAYIFDFIPDFTPAMGYVDDAIVLKQTLVVLAVYVEEEHKEKAEATWEKWSRILN
jgi:uncharacterized membrane protein YkvA (DUF1232 family)